MIRHIVLVRFKASVDRAERDSIFAQLAALQGKLSGIVAASFGRNVSPENIAQGFNDGFSMDFVDAAARDAYLADADHKAAGGRMVAALESGRDGIVVFDLEI